MIAVNNVTVDFGGNPLLDDVTFVISDKEKVALAGRNGAGKSTMLKMIAGLQKPTSGSVSTPRETVIGYLPQHMVTVDDVTLIEEAAKAFDGVKKLQARIDQMSAELASRTDYDSDEYMSLATRLSEESERMHTLGSANYMGEVEKTLCGLGFERKDFNRPTSEFSGGWRMRIELAKILLKHPDILLLDEPTNHLDIESIWWLENFLKNSSSSLVLVSHDRAFLDNVTTRTIEISLGKIYDYKVNYTHYEQLRAERREQQLRAFQNQQKEIADTEAFIEKFRYKATKSNQVQSRIKALEKIERIEVDEVDNSKLNLKFPPAPHSGSITVETKGLVKKYGEHTVLNGVDLTIKRGEKVAFVGRNGEGKSTLVKCIMNEIDYDGELKLGHLVKIGYFAQNQASLLDGEITVFDTIDRVATGEIRKKIKDILGAFMFGGEKADKKVKVLSGGERTRLAMIRLLLEPVNLLVLDEPTNHLDLRTKDVLKQAVKAFDGTVIVVSHDRDFLDGLVEKTYEFSNKKVTEHIGGIYDFLEKKKMENLREIEMSTPSGMKSQEERITKSKDNTPSAGQLSYEERKQKQRDLRKAQKAVEDAEKDIAKMEENIAKMEERMANGEAGEELLTNYGKEKKKLEERMYEWEILSAALDEMDKI